MSEDDEQGSAEHFHTVFERTQGDRVDDLSGIADDEHVAETDIEDHLSGDSGVRTAEESHERGLAVRQ